MAKHKTTPEPATPPHHKPTHAERPAVDRVGDGSAARPVVAHPVEEPADAAAATTDADIGAARIALGKLVARYGAPSATDAALLGSLLDDAARAKLGAKTRARELFPAGVELASQIDDRLTSFPAAMAPHYTRERYQYLLAELGVLSDTIAADDAKGSAQGSSKDTRATSLTAARAARNRLVDKLEAFAGKRPNLPAALKASLGATKTADDVSKSIAALVKLARGWLAAPNAVALGALVGFGGALVDQTAAVGIALSTAAADATLAGRRTGHDSPVLNVAEGSVIFELQEADRSVTSANKDSPAVARLVIPDSIRHAIRPAGGSDAENGAGEAAPSGASPTPAATTTPAT